jgi:hypothetical protein
MTYDHQKERMQDRSDMSEVAAIRAIDIRFGKWAAGILTTILMGWAIWVSTQMINVLSWQSKYGDRIDMMNTSIKSLETQNAPLLKANPISSEQLVKQPTHLDLPQ